MGPYLTSPIKQKHTKNGIWEQQKPFIWVSSCMQGWRNNMEDAEISEVNVDGQGTHIFGVFDGHGGTEVALFVQNHFVKEIKKLKSFQTKEFKLALEETFDKMDEMLRSKESHKEIQSYQELAGKQKQDTIAGCTANVALFHKSILFVANVGDSRSVLGLKNQGFKQMSFDHKPDVEEEKQRIIRAGGFVTENRVNGNLNLSRALGDLDYKAQASRKKDEQLIIAKPDIIECDLSTGEYDFLLMGCDGIWETKDQSLLIDYIRLKQNNNIPIQQLVHEFLDDHIASDVTKGIGCDNMSTILIRFTD